MGDSRHLQMPIGVNLFTIEEDDDRALIRHIYNSADTHHSGEFSYFGENSSPQNCDLAEQPVASGRGV